MTALEQAIAVIEMDAEGDRISLAAKVILAELRALRSAAPSGVAYGIRVKSDGSFYAEIVPFGYAMFDEKMDMLRSESWVTHGKAEIVPLYASPQPSSYPQPSDLSERLADETLATHPQPSSAKEGE